VDALCTQWDTGIRVSELASLTWKDLQARSEGGQLTVSKWLSIALDTETVKSLQHCYYRKIFTLIANRKYRRIFEI